MTTTGKGKTYCDACIQSYFFNSLRWEYHFDKTLPFDPTSNGTQCVDCCTRCEDICEFDDRTQCVNCEKDGAVLETLDVKRGWWRASKVSQRVYECPNDRACRGGSSTRTSHQCFHGHHGALCGSCKQGFEYNIASNRCSRCASTSVVLWRAGNIAMFLLVLFLVFTILRKRVPRYMAHVWTAGALALQEHAQGDAHGFGKGLDDHLEDILEEDSESSEEESSDSSEDEEEEEVKDDKIVEDKGARRRGLRRSILTKLKIIIAVWQIGASAPTVLFQVRLPEIFNQVTQLASIVGVALFNVGSFRCFFGWTYFQKMAVVTLAPIIAVPLVGLPYYLIQTRRRQSKVTVFSNVTYATLLFVYIVLPGIATYVITYFSCAHFDRGKEEHHNLRDLRVIAVELSIQCRGKSGTRYGQWQIFAAIMIVVWPIGAPLCIAVLLWRNRRKLNPTLTAVPENSGGGFQRQEWRSAQLELKKLQLREADTSITGLEFLFEEYECKSYLFPIFEIVRRLFLTSVLASFYPGSMQQVVVGVLGAMLSYVIYSQKRPFIEDDDNVVAAVAEGELVLIYFAALAAYTSEVSDQKRGVFTSAIFGAALTFIFFASFFVAVYVILLDVFGYSSVRQVSRYLRTQSVHFFRQRSASMKVVTKSFSLAPLTRRLSSSLSGSSSSRDLDISSPYDL